MTCFPLVLFILQRKEFLTVKSAGKGLGACIQTLDRTLNQPNFLFYEYGMKS